MKLLHVLFLFTTLVVIGISCKNDKAPQNEELVTAPNEIKSESQNTTTAVGKLYRSNEVDTPALFSSSCKGAENEAKCSQNLLREYINKNLVKPNNNNNNNNNTEIKQREVITFTILSDGTTGSIRSISKKEVCSGCRKAAIQVISTMPRWTPATKKGEAVAMSMTIPVSF